MAVLAPQESVELSKFLRGDCAAVTAPVPQAAEMPEQSMCSFPLIWSWMMLEIQDGEASQPSWVPAITKSFK
jgi:hypothetical protein